MKILFSSCIKVKVLIGSPALVQTRRDIRAYGGVNLVFVGSTVLLSSQWTEVGLRIVSREVP